MRFPIWKKDDFFQFVSGPRIDMNPAVVILPEEPLGLVWNYDFDRAPIGRVVDIKLEDGEITGELQWAPEMERYEQFLKPEEEDGRIIEPVCRLGGYYSDVEQRYNVVTKCTLRSVSIMLLSQTPGWSANPGAKI